MRIALIGAMLALAPALTPPLFAAPAPQTPAQSAKAFLDGIYVPWVRQLHTRNGRSFKMPADELIYVPELVQLMKKDQRNSARTGDVGVIDWVILCNCQDDGGMTATVTITAATATTATAKVSLGFGGNDRQIITLKLVKLPQGWRIADVADSDMPSLLALLRKDLGNKR